jgi:hypothetical protein
MTSTAASLISFGCIFGGSLIGIFLRSVLPERYFTNEEKDVLRLGLGLITTLSALVLGLLISTAKSSFDAKRAQLTELATDVISIDRSLDLYGSEASSARSALHNQVAALLDGLQALDAGASKLQPSSEAGSSKLQPSSGAGSSKLQPLSEVDANDFYRAVRRLSPRDDSQRSLKAEVLRVSLEVGRIRASALARESSSMPMPFLVVLVFWLTALFVGFGLFTSRNLIAVAALCVCALTVSTAVFLILDMDQPVGGFMKISSEPLRKALVVIDEQP